MLLFGFSQAVLGWCNRREDTQWETIVREDPFRYILDRDDTARSRRGLFDLQTAGEAGKNHKKSFDCDHLQFD